MLFVNHKKLHGNNLFMLFSGQMNRKLLFIVVVIVSCLVLARSLIQTMKPHGESYEYLISVIIPVFNAECYVEETIQSILRQTIGFEQNIQMILINDGSKDNSSSICLHYASLYPSNIVYFEQENMGSSAARNAGFRYATGKYVNFLDSDDIWEPQAFSRICSFFDSNFDIIDAVAGRIRFFEAKTNYHILDYKFFETRIVDLVREFEDIQISASSAVLKRSAIQNIHFINGLIDGEDAQFMCSLLLQKLKYGVVREAEYYYRQRSTKTSSVQTKTLKRSWYLDSPKLFLQNIMNQSIETHGYILEFIQFTVMYDLQWRLKQNNTRVLTSTEWNNYHQTLECLLQSIDDRIIEKQRSLTTNQKKDCLNLKYHGRLRTKLFTSKHRREKIPSINIFSLQVKNNSLNIEINDITQVTNETYYYTAVVKQISTHSLIIYPSDSPYNRSDIPLRYRYSKMVIPLSECSMTIRFFLEFSGSRLQLNFSLGKYSSISNERTSYVVRDQWLISVQNSQICVNPYNFYYHILHELRHCINLLISCKFKILTYRLAYHCHPYRHRTIWLLSDRTNKAGDNGEFFFKYLLRRMPKHVHCYYCISRRSADYARMKQIGNTIDIDSCKYKLYILLCHLFISSSADEPVINPFGKEKKYIADLYHFDFVFLQHGVIRDDLSGWIGKQSKNVNLFITSSPYEYQSILTPRYGYTRHDLVLTGLPRFDNLFILNSTLAHQKTKKILLAPTWRRQMIKDRNISTNKIILTTKFEETEYYRFYQSLITDPSLQRIMDTYGYQGLYIQHPRTFEDHPHIIKGTKLFAVSQSLANYSYEFISSSLLITDYSSVAFDFAYLRKPVIYTQFDTVNYFSTHTSTWGYFNYSTMGFGPVCETLQCTVHALIEAIKNNCRQQENYVQRIDKFFKYSDARNCDRVFDAITTRLPDSIGSHHKDKDGISRLLVVFVLCYELRVLSHRARVFIKKKG